jgi:hypothetical protein
MRAAPLTTIRGGINRLRTKGGAKADILYDLLNGYVTEAGSVKVRPGTERDATLDPLTRGLCAFGGELHTFCHVAVAVPEGYVLNILVHPEPTYQEYYLGYADETAVPLEKIHFAEPFLGGLYVVAEFQDGATYHFWLQPGTEWQADTVYEAGDLVIPTTPNGLVFSASRFGDANPPWQPDEPRYDGVGDAYAQSVVEPTEYNGFYYVCVETAGPNPRSALTEPVWPTFEGGTVIERTDTGQPETAPIDSPTPPPAGSTSGGTIVTGGGGGGSAGDVLEPVIDRYTYR